ncbi:MAG: glycosyltransferase family 8 protein [Oscillospiraceae bacterium]|nr:glycosyltransferase family 8 protein [Oscillospiraceae bacterium]
MNKHLPAVFICDRGYVMQTAVAITSLIESCVQTSPEIRVVTYGLTPEQERELLGLAREGASVRLVRGDECFSEDSFSVTESRYRVATKAALLKFYLPALLPDWDRVLYLDGDIIVRRDLSPLAETELGDALAAVVRDLPQVFYNNRLLGDSRDYFNSGVMLLNLRQMRAEGLTGRLVEEKKASPDDKLMDQSVLNRVMAGRVLQLPLIYNVCYANLRRRWRREHMARQINAAYGTDFRTLRQIRQAAAILHYSSGEKPWKYFDIPAGRDWLRVYRRLPGAAPLRRKSWQLREKGQKIKAILSALFSRRSDANR